MISRNEAELVISEKLKTDRLMRIIRNTSSVAWENVISEGNINKWLENFNGKYFESVENEQKLALWLLLHFTYYTDRDVRTLCRDVFNRYLHEKLLTSGASSVKNGIDDILKNTVFASLGNDSESGHNILYYFRQVNFLPKSYFEIDASKKYENLVFIDDVTISGSQAMRYINGIKNGTKYEADNLYLVTLIATDDAAKKISENGNNKIRLLASMILDDRDRAFSDDAYVFSDEKVNCLIPYAKEFCETYGRIAVQGWEYMEDYPLGYNDGQYMFGFQYNIPNNTLPIFWGTGGSWTPLFPRYEKFYGKEYRLDGRKYY